jgi:HEAT repeat protein
MRLRRLTTPVLVVGLILGGAAVFQLGPFLPPLGTRTDVAIAMLKMAHPDPAQRLAGVRTIKSLPPAVAAPAVRALVVLLGDEGSVTEEGLEPITYYPAEEAVTALSSLGRYAVETVIEALRSPHERVRMRAVRALGGMQNTPRADDALVQVMLSSNEKVLRTLAAMARAARRDERALPVLSAAVLDPQSSLRGAAAHALAALGNPEGAAPILAALKTITGAGQLDSQLQWQFADALGLLRAPESEEPLAALVRHPDDMVRRAAIAALGRVARRMRPELIEMLQYPRGPTREWAAMSLSHIHDPASIPVVARMLEHGMPGWEVSIALSPFGTDALDAVARRLRHDDANVRRNAMIALGHMLYPQQVAAARKYEHMVLSLIANDPSVDVRRAAIEAMVRFPGSSEDLIDALVRALDDAPVAPDAVRVLQVKTELHGLTTGDEWRAWRASQLARRAATERFWNVRIPVRGKVVHPDGRAATGVLVALVQLGDNDSVDVWPIRKALSARTGADGMFAMHVRPAKGILEADRDFIFVGWIGDRYRFLARDGKVARYRFTVDPDPLDAGALTIYPTLHPPTQP